jgi:glycosyltransferase involved in cell wall biosynthesis
MDTDEITPLVIAFNEGPNLGRCLERLKWARRIVVMDSGSTDDTLAICARFPSVEVHHRPFDSFAGQCNAGLERIWTPWVLSLDSDYLMPTGFPEEISGLGGLEHGYRAGFRYCVYGRPLRSCLYPPRTVLYRRAGARYEDDGHGHRVVVPGPVGELKSVIDHDDCKPLARWLASQRKYAEQEAEKLLAQTGALPVADRIRKRIWLAPGLVFFYTLFWKRAALDGWPGFFYVLQRTYFELLLSLELLDRRLRGRK